MTLAASRYARDADTPAATDILESAKKTIGDALSKDNIDAVVSSLSALGDKAKQLGDELAKAAAKSAQ